MADHITKLELERLSPSEFENLIFDLAVFSGLYNVIRRTPSADGGRDIVGLFLSKEFSGSFTNEKWSIECKHYSKSLSWGKIAEKVYTAMSDDTDYLLIATSSTLSNPCKDQIEKWNLKHSKPKLRYWQHDNIINMINMNSYIKEKFFDKPISYISFFSNENISHLKELILTASSEIDDENASPSLISTSSVIELIDNSYHDMINYKILNIHPITTDDLFSWMNIFDLQNNKIDKYIFRAISSLLYTYARPHSIKCNIEKYNSLSMELVKRRFDISQQKISYLNQLASIKNYIFYLQDKSNVILSLR